MKVRINKLSDLLHITTYGNHGRVVDYVKKYLLVNYDPELVKISMKLTDEQVSNLKKLRSQGEIINLVVETDELAVDLIKNHGLEIIE